MGEDRAAAGIGGRAGLLICYCFGSYLHNDYGGWRLIYR